jgi:hypothetical protein
MPHDESGESMDGHRAIVASAWIKGLELTINGGKSKDPKSLSLKGLKCLERARKGGYHKPLETATQVQATVRRMH